MNKKKLVICFDSPGYGGSEINLLKLIDYLKHSYIITLIISAKKSLEVQLFISKHKLEFLEFDISNKFASITEGISKSIFLLKRVSADIFIFWNHHLKSYRWLQVSAALLNKNYLIVEQLLPTMYKKPYLSLTTSITKRYICSKSVKIVICGYSQEQNYKLKFKTNNTIVIPNTREILYINSLVNNLRLELTRKDGFTICCVARLTDQKNQETLVEAFANLKSNSKINLLLVGDGENRVKLENLINAKSIKNITITGFTNSIYKYLAVSDLFVLPSLEEGLPGALIEAMACGVPCVATNVAGNNELVIHGDTGYLFVPQNIAELTNLLEFLISHQEERLRISEKAFLKVKNNYDFVIETGKWEKLLGEYFDSYSS